MRLRLFFTFYFTKGIKMKHAILAMVISLTTISVTNAHDREPVFFKSVTPCDVLTGVGLYIRDVGCNTVTGTRKVIRGTGEIITSPFRSRLHWPKPRMFRYERGFWVPPKLERLPTKPPSVTPKGILGTPAPPLDYDRNPKPLPSNFIHPLHKDIDNKEFITLVEFNF
jgi:hypothetical protein